MTSTAINTLRKWVTLKYFAGLLLVSLSFESSAFGTLFTSPQQREALDQQRAQGEMYTTEERVATQLKESQLAAPAKEQQVFFNGYVIRKFGPSTAWANQKKLPKTDNNKFQNGISAKLDEIKGTSVPVKISTLSNPTWLQPGQRLNKSTREISESYQFKRSIPKVKKAETVENLESLEQAEDDSTEFE